ncbi:aminoglycoside phosphotransferase family protein [Virgibacillus halodenitrificans]|uniref:aminoglycoside phosphotransferase family protein n=1 Tax=Virgibacillus halodenitrificans TaxID=1482 RepID=UPI001FB42510|nr:aminoglycoside phosphotransferase family protein [Virgibacillus halodenitrificans]MCJ0931460.1 aminoglycoside phosphotransferase family protein [Virgibacillus halodenitrificans]
MQIPQAFQTKINNAFGKEGEKWLNLLPKRVDIYLHKWKLVNHGPVTNLSYNYVLNVTDTEGNPYILKLGVPNADFANEIRTVQIYNGTGCARVIKAVPEEGVMLLEQLQPGTMLDTLETEEEQLVQFVNVWKAIRRPIPPREKQQTPFIADWFQGITTYRKTYREGDRIKEEHLLLAEQYIEEINQTTKGAALLHGDLHHENILYSMHKGWLAIDPKGVIGDEYYDTVSFLINKLEGKSNQRYVLRYRVKRLSELLQLEEKRLLKAAVALSTLYACWAQEDGVPEWKQTYQCTIWFSEFLAELLQ